MLASTEISCKVLQCSIESGDLDINTIFANGNSLLHYVVTHPNLAKTEFIEWLLKYRELNIDALNNEKFTPLLCAIKYRRWKIVGLLLDHGASIDELQKININQPFDDIGTMLHFAVSYEKTNLFKWLLNKEDLIINVKNKFKRTALFDAIRLANVQMVNALITKGANCYGKDVNGMDLLLYAFTQLKNELPESVEHRERIEEIIFILLNTNKSKQELALLSVQKAIAEKYLDINIRFSYLDDAPLLSLIISTNHESIFNWVINRPELLLESVDLYGRTALFYAVLLGNLAMVKKLINKGINLDCQDKLGRTALCYAIEGFKKIEGKEKFEALLKQNSASINISDNDGDSPLHFATITGDVNLVEKLLDHGANINAVNSRNNTALHLGAQDGYLDIITLLINKNADQSVLNEDNLTAQEIANNNKWPLNITTDLDYLLADREEVSINLHEMYNMQKNSALHIAAYNNHASVVRDLLENGDNPLLKNYYGKTALFVAIEQGNVEVAEVFFSLGYWLNGEQYTELLNKELNNKHLECIKIPLKQTLGIISIFESIIEDQSLSEMKGIDMIATNEVTNIDAKHNHGKDKEKICETVQNIAQTKAYSDEQVSYLLNAAITNEEEGQHNIANYQYNKLEEQDFFEEEKQRLKLK